MAPTRSRYQTSVSRLVVQYRIIFASFVGQTMGRKRRLLQRNFSPEMQIDLLRRPARSAITQSGPNLVVSRYGRLLCGAGQVRERRSEEHTSELQSLMRISYAVFCLKKKTHENTIRY